MLEAQGVLRSVRLRPLRATVVIACICWILWTTSRSSYVYSINAQHETIPIVPEISSDFNSTKPENQTIIGLVFYGRADRVRLLNCYLERNLQSQGGWLDEVHFVRNTDNVTDLVFLDTLVEKNPRYRILELRSNSTEANDRYKEAWSRLQLNSIYVKIDDDVIWLADDAIPRMVTRKLRQTDYLVVSASVINHPLMSQVHYDAGAYHPYLPAHTASTPPTLLAKLLKDKEHGKSPWQYDHYPFWTGPDEYNLMQDETSTSLSPVWLRLNDSTLDRTPISGIKYDSWGPGWNSWTIAAQSHLSLLENLYKHNLRAYYNNGLNDEVWFTEPNRVSINLIAVWSNDILDNIPEEGFDDEEWLTVTLPQQLRKNVGVETRALAAHFSFGAQREMEKTDLLARYAAYADEMACLKQWQYGTKILQGNRTERNLGAQIVT